MHYKKTHFTLIGNFQYFQIFNNVKIRMRLLKNRLPMHSFMGITVIVSFVKLLRNREPCMHSALHPVLT